MSHSDKAIFIIGGGVSGLVCAQVLEQYGYQPTILEISSRVGGRVVTDHKNGYQLDKGFQVMLDAYPLTKKYLKYDQLELQKLSPGAVLFKDGKQSKFGDPLRDSQFLFPTFTSSHATLLDKWKVYRLRKKLLKKSTEDIFETPETTTLKYLKAQGFSNRIINNFFKPFFSGIYLETDLSTSSRMFEFVYKMFAEGDATIPKSGIQEIPDQLHSQLKQTDVRLNTGVISVSNEEIMLESGEVLKSDFCVIATDPEGILPNYTSSLEWKSCDTLYFTSHTREIRSPIIGLNTNPNALVNNIFYASSVETQDPHDMELLSTTVIKKHDLSLDELIEEVKKELKDDFGVDGVSFLHHYHIKQALPQLRDIRYKLPASETKIMENIAIAGDYLLNGSLNAAMIAGEQAAIAAHSSITNTRME